MSESGDPRIVLRDPVGVADRVIDHPGQPREYVDERGKWAHTDSAANWRRVDDANLRIYDVVEPTTG
jgi:hypothetical protein